MGRWLLRLDGSFSAGARLALAAIVVVSFAAGYLGRAAGDPGDGGAAPVAPGRIEADLPAPPADSGPALTSAAALPGLAGGIRRRTARAAATPVATATPEPTATSEPVETPLETPTAAPTPAATPAPPPPAPPAATPTPGGTTFDSSG